MFVPDTTKGANKTGSSFSSIFSVHAIRQFLLNIKEPSEIVFYGLMALQPWFIVPGAALFPVILLPLVAVALAGMAILDVYELARAPNKNLDRWLATLVALVCTILASISISSLVLGTLLGFSFAAGPWLFLGSVSFFAASTVFNLGLTAWRILESPPKSPQRMHYVQRFLSQLNMLLTAASIIACVTFVILFPVAPPIMTALAAVCVLLTAINLGWRFMPATYRQSLKNWVGLGKPDFVPLDYSKYLKVNEINIQLEPAKAIRGIKKPRLTAPDYLSQIKTKDLDEAQCRFSLCSIIETYEKSLRPYDAAPQRVRSKHALLNTMKKNLEEMQNNSNCELEPFHMNNSCQSFFRDVGEFESIVNAYRHVEREYISSRSSADCNGIQPS